MMAKATAAEPSPPANFAGLDGCVSSIRSHSHEKTDASETTKIGSTAWNQLAGNEKPNRFLRVSCSAKSVKLDPACSNDIQKTAEKMNRTPIAPIRFHSSRVSVGCSPPDAVLRSRVGRYPT